MRVNNPTLLKRKHCTGTAGMKLGPDPVVDDLIKGILVGGNWRYKLCSLQQTHWWGIQDPAIEQQGRDKDLTVYRVGQPPRVNSRRLKRISRSDLAGPSGERVHHSKCQTPGVVVDDLIRSYGFLGQSSHK